MSQMSPLRRKILTAMASNAGRRVRMGMAVAIMAGAILAGGWALLFLALGLFMLVMGIINYCPARGMLAKDEIQTAFLTSFDKADVVVIPRGRRGSK
jgi:hypothetical protein